MLGCLSSYRKRQRWLPVIFFVIAGGCQESENPQTHGRQADQRRPSEPALRALLDLYDEQYDPHAHMLQVEFKSPGYHSRVKSGVLVHPTRESLIYALALLQRNSHNDADRSTRILRRVLSLQDVDEDSSTRGVWPWLLEEPLDQMEAPDLNWADFCGAQIGQMLVDHADQLSPSLQESMRRSLRLAAEAIRKRNVGPGYTNIAVLGGGVCVVAGEVLDEQQLQTYGRQRLQGVVDYTAKHGGFTEYNSPPYGQVVIAECERTLQLIRDPQARQAAESLRVTAWRMIADSFHAPTAQWAGPHARTSRDRLRANVASFLSRRVGIEIPVHPTMAAGEPRGFAVVRPLPCPADLVAAFREKVDDVHQVQRTFLKSRTPSRSLVATTWFDPVACIGSVNHSTFWTQRKPLIAYWRTEADPAVVFRAQFLHDGRDFASMGLRSVQVGPRVLCVLHPLPDKGAWHPSLDRPADGVFEVSDFRVRFALRGVGTTVRDIGQGRFELSAGRRRIIIHTVAGDFARQPVEWQTGQVDDAVVVDGICHVGEMRQFNFRDSFPVSLCVGIELLRDDEEIAVEPPVMSSSRQAAWKPTGESNLTVAIPMP